MNRYSRTVTASKTQGASQVSLALLWYRGEGGRSGRWRSEDLREVEEQVADELFVQAMLYATDGIDSEADLAKPMVGVANVW
mgnify:FL=1